MRTTRINMGSAMLALLAAFVSCLSCHWHPFSADDVSHYDAVARESFFYEVNVAGQTRLRLEGINGEVTVTGVDGQASVTIEGERRVESDSSSDAEAHLRELEVRVDELGNEISTQGLPRSELHRELPDLRPEGHGNHVVSHQRQHLLTRSLGE